MGKTELPGNPPIPITLRRSGRARRLSLRVSGLDGRVTLTLPKRASEREALNFARDREGWIRDALHGQPGAVYVAPGMLLPVHGRERLVTLGPRTGLTEDALMVRPGRLQGQQALDLIKAEARTRITESATRHAAALGRGFGRITLRDTRSRWGSCSSSGDLMLSWRLILAPPEVLDYVVAHEVAHLERMDHSPDFWAVVARLAPEHAAPRDWLRRQGSTLHRWRFED